MKVAIINKSDATGGAAVVSRRLMEALREEGVDPRLIVCEKLSDSPFVELAAGKREIKWKFLIERLKIFLITNFNKKNLFKIDTGEVGLPLWKNSWVKEADAVLINWVNQGMLSLEGLKKILELEKPVIITMHDMWWMTGICHHAGKCNHFQEKCGDCPLLGNLSASGDLSNKIWKRKLSVYEERITKRLALVAVSSWLKRKCLESSLLRNKRIEIIPNAFNLIPASLDLPTNSFVKSYSPIRILFGAARLDDPIKGLYTLKEVSKIIEREHPETAAHLEIAMFGNIKDEKALDGFKLPVVKLGVLHGEEEVRKVYENSEIVVSASSYETLPGTLVEAQAYGCIPVSFNQGGQRDIIEDGITGFIAVYTDDLNERARNLADGILKAYEIVRDAGMHKDFITRMHKNVESKFSYSRIARQYIALINSL